MVDWRARIEGWVDSGLTQKDYSVRRLGKSPEYMSGVLYKHKDVLDDDLKRRIKDLHIVHLCEDKKRRRKLSDEQIRSIRRMSRNGVLYRELKYFFDVPISKISKIVRREAYQDVV